MKINFTKRAGGILEPFDESEQKRMERFKNDASYEIEIKTTRNPKFHGKVFAFFNFCFEHWSCGDPYLDDPTQREVFRKDLAILAGFYDAANKINGDVELKAKSLSYSNMEQAEFESCYNALINAALEHLFGAMSLKDGVITESDNNLYLKLVGFF